MRPEVAILGVGKSVLKPVWDGKAFAPRLMLPLSLSYDHRVVDGAQGARFIAFLSGVLSDIRSVGALMRKPRGASRETEFCRKLFTPLVFRLVPIVTIDLWQLLQSASSAARSILSISVICGWRRRLPNRYTWPRFASCLAERRRIAQRPRSTAQQRMDMVLLATAGNPLFTVDDREVRRSGPGYTVDYAGRAEARNRHRASALPAARRRRVH